MRGLGAAVILVLALMVTRGATAATPGLTVRGDPQAWAEIEAVFLKFNKVKSYRAKIAGGFAGTMEAINPDRFHYMMTFGGMTMESIQVGKDMRFRQGTDAWRCTSQPMSVPGTNPTGMQGEVSASKGPAVVIDGVQTQSYTYNYKSTQPGAPGNLAITARLFVAIGTGLPKRIQTLGENEKVEMQFDYYDYDAPVTITLPDCK